jgi:hypothetical protein
MSLMRPIPFGGQMSSTSLVGGAEEEKIPRMGIARDQPRFFSWKFECRAF